ncbi:MAG: amidohydrolase family protein [Acidobacteria bacterium]|nr:amidohydrolase family protein [Acidobacteriota bacterium]
MTSATGARTASAIHDELGHPVVDADGHWHEPVAVFCDFLRDEAGAAAVDAFRAFNQRRHRWYEFSRPERLSQRYHRQGWWAEPTNTLDRATAMLPKLLHERLPELGIDFAIVYPTLGLVVQRLPDDDLRPAAVRALNRMTAELFAPFSDRMTPAAAIPVQTPGEAVDELRFAAGELGFKVVMLSGAVTRSVDRDGSPRQYLDTLGLDSPYDYEPLWSACVEMGVAFTDHGGSVDWPSRQSPTNYVFNHVGHFAEAQHTTSKAILLGGVTRRHPDLRFAFLEGGVGWARQLLLDLEGHWEKRNLAALLANLRPTNVDRAALGALYDTYASGPAAGRFDEIWATSPSSINAFTPVDEQAGRERDDMDDFAPGAFESAEEMVEELRRAFWFGCEADDPMTALAFGHDFGPHLDAMFASDIGHFDVIEMAGVLPEAWELVEGGKLDPAEFGRFTFDNVVRLHGGMNPDFFKGTVVEQTAADLLTD